MYYSRILFLSALCLATNISQSQTYNNPGGTITTCSGGFYDTGGNLLSYSDNENIITTFCSAAAGQCLSVTFSFFDLELNYDFLSIYDGPATTYPLIGRYTGANSPGTIISGTGCLTFVFTSDYSVTNLGWQATVSCPSCPPPSCPGPVPDDCSAACNLGTLNAPPACPFTGNGTNVFYLSNIGATPSSPYLYLNGCQPSGGSMASPAADVWYTFVASSNIIDVSLFGLPNPNIGLYEGNSCNTFVGRGCAVGSGGSLNATFQPMLPGRRYYLQISGGDTAETENFRLSISGRNDCDPCVINAALTASPLPTNGVYRAGTTVHFCFTVTYWRPTSVNWLHGIVPTFGECWDLSSLRVYPPPTCDNNGSWNWYNSVTSSQTGQVNGPGFFYESTLGCGVCDPNDPGDNYGDNCTGQVNFVFCWDITVAQCISGNSLNVSVNTFGDGESGSWTSFACAADPIFDFFATYTTCPDPLMQLRGVSCSGGTNGQSIAQGQGTPPFDFIWRDSTGRVIKTSAGIVNYDTLNSLSAGIYSIEQTDAGLCTNTVSFNIDEPAPLAINLNATPVSCTGLNDGSMDVVLSGGTPPYEYSLDGVSFQSSATFTGLAFGTYTVTARDDSNCVITAITSISEPAPLTIARDSIIEASCSTGNNGAIYVTVSGGTSPYVFNWSNTTTAEDITDLPGGNYALTVSDSNGCVAADSFTVTTGAGIALSSAVGNISCHGGSDGSIDLTVSNAISPAYAWSNTSSSEDLTDIPAGSYSVTVVDASQCADTATYFVTEPPAILLSGTILHLLCNSDNSGAIDLTASGGTPPFSFVWSNNAATADINGLAAGNYSVTATDSNFCTATASFALTQPDSVELSYVKTDVRCTGGNDGAIDVSITGGTSPFQTIWSNNATTEDVSGLYAGSYDLVVLDSNACAATVSVTISEPAPLIVNGAVTHLLCNGGTTGTVDITVTGGTPPYNFLWSDSSSSEDLTAVAASAYTLSASDANQCSNTSTFVITEPPALVLSGIATNLLCQVNNSGAIDLTTSGGTPPYSFTWSNNASSEDLSGLDVGSYSVTATDSNGCTATASFALTQPNSFVLSYTTTDVSCFGGNDGAIEMTVVTGTAPFRFLWSTNDTFEDLGGLMASTYDLIAMDVNSCTAAASVTINEPPPLTMSGSTTDALCHGTNTGRIDITPSGGSPPYGYRWSNALTSEDLTAVTADTYSVVVTDFNACTATASFTVSEPDSLLLSGVATDVKCFDARDGSIRLSASGGTLPYEYSIDGIQFQSDSSFSNLAGGNYPASVRDGNGCSDTLHLAIRIPPALSTFVITDSVDCFGGSDGSAAVSPSGGSGTFLYAWSNNSTASVANNLTAGIYFVTVTDGNGCLAKDTAAVYQPPAMTLMPVILNVQCNGSGNGSVSLNVSGGTPGYTYLWSTHQTLAGIDSLKAGAYSVTVTDSNGCIEDTSVSVSEPAVLTLSISTVPAICNGDSNGIASVSVTGGTPPYRYQWDAAAGNQMASSAVNLPAGSYSVVVTDAVHCTATRVAEIHEPPSLTVIIDTFIDPLCHGESTGMAHAAASGGTYPIAYAWNTSPTTSGSLLSAAPAGNYHVVATDGNGCTAEASVTLTAPPPLIVRIIPSDTSIHYGDSLQLHAVHSPATLAPLYTWAPAHLISWCINPCSAPFVAPENHTTFSVIITVEGGNCADTAWASVNVEYTPTVHVPNAFTPDGDGINDVFEVFFNPALRSMDYKIFNRWGVKLFESQTPGKFWDGTYRGKPQNPGVYVYVVDASFWDGEKKQFKGSFTLLR